jgi:hypothetical protein
VFFLAYNVSTLCLHFIIKHDAIRHKQKTIVTANAPSIPSTAVRKQQPLRHGEFVEKPFLAPHASVNF